MYKLFQERVNYYLLVVRINPQNRCTVSKFHFLDTWLLLFCKEIIMILYLC